MSISADGWFDWMIRDPAPDWKQNGGTNTIKGVVPHSAEGYWPYLRDGDGMLFSNARSSWHFSNLKDGRCFQHYPVWSQCWTSGSGYPNNNFVAWENEGVQGEPFTQQQTDNCIRIIRELSALGGWKPRRPTAAGDFAATMYEHNECQRWGSKYTQCPSGRVPWGTILSALNEEDEDMKPIRIWCAERRMTYLLGPFGAVEVKSAADDKEFEKLYGAHAAVLTGAQCDALLAT